MGSRAVQKGRNRRHPEVVDCSKRMAGVESFRNSVDLDGNGLVDRSETITLAGHEGRRRLIDQQGQLYKHASTSQSTPIEAVDDEDVDRVLLKGVAKSEAKFSWISVNHDETINGNRA